MEFTQNYVTTFSQRFSKRREHGEGHEGARNGYGSVAQADGYSWRLKRIGHSREVRSPYSIRPALERVRLFFVRTVADLDAMTLTHLPICPLLPVPGLGPPGGPQAILCHLVALLCFAQPFWTSRWAYGRVGKNRSYRPGKTCRLKKSL